MPWSWRDCVDLYSYNHIWKPLDLVSSLALSVRRVIGPADGRWQCVPPAEQAWYSQGGDHKEWPRKFPRIMGQQTIFQLQEWRAYQEYKNEVENALLNANETRRLWKDTAKPLSALRERYVHDTSTSGLIRTKCTKCMIRSQASQNAI